MTTGEHLHYALNSAQLQRLLFINTIGVSIISEALIQAAYLFGSKRQALWRHNKPGLVKQEQYQEAYLFIQGTGLDIVIENYGLDYNAESLREGFNQIFHVKTSC